MVNLTQARGHMATRRRLGRRGDSSALRSAFVGEVLFYKKKKKKKKKNHPQSQTHNNRITVRFNSNSR